MKKKILMMLVITLLVFSAIPVMAAESPTAAPIYNITVNGEAVDKDGGSIKVDGGTISVSKGTVNVGEEITLTATAGTDNKFSKWVISGDYTIVSGSLTDGTITIIPNEDLDIDAKFVDADGKTVENPTKKGDVDKSVTSPKTGVSTNVLLMVLLLSGTVAIASRKRITE